MRRGAAIAAVCALCACGGTSSDGLGVSGVEGPAKTYSAMFNTLVDMGEAHDNAVLAPMEALPAAGTATYDGYLFLGSRTFSYVVDAAVGDLTLTFDLADNSFAGAATDFRGRDSINNELSTVRNGTLLIEDGQVLRSDVGVAVTANVNGSLEFGNATQAIDGTLSGGFRGEDAGSVGGTVEVGYPVDPIVLSPTLTLDRLPLEGAFVAEAR